MKSRILILAAAVALGLVPGAASAAVKVGITLSATGPAATLGITERNVFTLVPRELDGQKIDYIVLDDASDPATAVRNVRRLIDQDNVDIIIGSSTSPNSLAILDTVAKSKRAMISMGTASAIVLPMTGAHKWAFKCVYNDSTKTLAVFHLMQAMNFKKIGYIGLDDASSEGWLKELQKLSAKSDIKFADVEKYNRTDRSVVSQALRLIATHPDGIFISASSTPGATPMIDLRRRGYKGPLLAQDGVASNEVMRLAGPAAEGLIVPMGPLVIADQLPNSDPVKQVSEDIIKRYEAKFGAGTRSTFISNAYDPILLLKAALPGALKTAKPGTAEFRSALRDSLEQIKNLVGTQGIYNMTPEDHVGLNEKSIRMVRYDHGKWDLIKK